MNKVVLLTGNNSDSQANAAAVMMAKGFDSYSLSHSVIELLCDYFPKVAYACFVAEPLKDKALTRNFFSDDELVFAKMLLSHDEWFDESLLKSTGVDLAIKVMKGNNHDLFYIGKVMEAVDKAFIQKINDDEEYSEKTKEIVNRKMDITPEGLVSSLSKLIEKCDKEAWITNLAVKVSENYQGESQPVLVLGMQNSEELRLGKEVFQKRGADVKVIKVENRVVINSVVIDGESVKFDDRLDELINQ